jgi:microtubule-associated protein-like 6
VGGHDTNIFVYAVDAGTSALKLKSKFTKHNAAIVHFDLSMDGKYLRSVCNAYELLFSETNTGKQITSATELRDVKWASGTSILGWDVQGIWESGLDGSDINACDRSNTGHLLAVGDDFSKVKVYRYPTLSPLTAKKTVLQGHSSHVTNVKWSVGDEFLLSAGGDDKCVFQWRHKVVGCALGHGIVSADHDDEFVGGADSLDVPTGGDEGGAVKPWVGAIR